MLELVNDLDLVPTAGIKMIVVGVGGAGGNAINSMAQVEMKNITLVAANTDVQALRLSKADRIIQLGIKSTKGLGAGANPDLGKRAAEEELTTIMSQLEDADIVFLTGGMGGGTGSGALPVIARALHEKNILCIAIVTRPFQFEGKRRAAIAQDAIEQLKKEVDTLLVIPNQKLIDSTDTTISMLDAFEVINKVLANSIKGIADIISRPGHINVDFADVRAIMKDRGLAIMGTAHCSGPERALKAAQAAISSPLLENMTIQGAKGILLNISGSSSLGLHEIGLAANVIYEQADPNATIILGSVIDDALGDEMVVTVIATGFDSVINSQQSASVLNYSQKMKDIQEPVNIKPTVRIPEVDKVHAQTLSGSPSEEIVQQDSLDTPTFMRIHPQQTQDR